MNGPSPEPAREGRMSVVRRARWFERGPRDADELWLVLHGYGQLARPFLDSCGALARERRLLVAPEALSRFYLRGGRGPIGASWMTREERESEIEDYVDYLESLLELITRDSAPTAQVCVLGFSQGVAAAWRWAVRARRAPRRLIALGGGSPAELDLGAPRLRQIEVLLATGERDEAFTPQQAEAERARLEAAGVRCELALHPRGHEVDAELLARL